jgi:K+-sensing histidine kinase KdpD
MKMRDRFEDIMSAITFSEAGEHETAQIFLNQKKTVLFAVSDKMFDQSAFRYALGTSNRINANLEILYVAAKGDDPTAIRESVSEAAGSEAEFNLIVKTGSFKQAILDYSEKNREIQFVVIGSEPELEKECKAAGRSITDVMRHLKCPLVVVSRSQTPVSAYM